MSTPSGSPAAAQPVIRVLVADDHPVVRAGLVAILSQQPDMVVVAEAENGADAVDAFRLHRPDVTLMDVRMPKMSGVEAIAALVKEFPQARLIVVTTYDSDEDIFHALQAGARGYLLKDAGREMLLAAVRSVHAGQMAVPPDIAAKMTQRVAGPQLTAREREVLLRMVEGQTNGEIAKALFIGEATVKTHINNLLKKLGVTDRGQAIAAAIKRGIVHVE